MGFGLSAAAEEFHLKDGTKIVGKIVAYEQDAFRVETSFGIAIIFKDRILRIVFPDSAPEKPSAPAAGNLPKAVEVAPPPASKPEAVRTEKNSSPPPLPVKPETIVEHVTGTSYLNETLHFRLFKPPTWRSYPHLVRPDTPMVAALGTPDETTLLLIGLEAFNGDLSQYARQAERSLQQFYEDYRRRGEQAIQVAGLPALEYSFTGEAEGRFWTGTAVYFARGQQHYTLLGVTAAGDTTSFQQALLRKVVGSLEFLPE